MARIVRAKRDDLAAIHRLLHALAEYEDLVSSFRVTQVQLEAVLFDGSPHVFCELALRNGHPVGLALWYKTFPSFDGRYGMWLEDLFVEPEQRGGGLGLALLTHIARIATNEGFATVSWNVLDWNEPSIRFYEALGAVRNEPWREYVLKGDALSGLASRGV